MNPKQEQQIIRIQQEKLIKELKAIYRKTFDNLSGLELSERSVARLTQSILRSQEGAINLLNEGIATPVITHSPTQQ